MNIGLLLAAIYSTLNRMLTSLNKNELKYYIEIIAFISTVLPLFVKSLRPFGDMNSASVLITVYLIVG